MFFSMEPCLTGNPATPKPSPSSTLRPGPFSSGSASTTTAPTSDRLQPKLTLPTPQTTPSSSPSTASPRTSPCLSSQSTPPASPLRQPIRSPSQVGRSQLNATSTGIPPTGFPVAGAAAMAQQPSPTPESGENQSLSFDLLHL